jgi:hypothetical protein
MVPKIFYALLNFLQKKANSLFFKATDVAYYAKFIEYFSLVLTQSLWKLLMMYYDEHLNFMKKFKPNRDDSFQVFF